MKRLLSFTFAFQGIRDLFQSQPNARLHALAAVLILILGGWLNLDRIEWMLVLLSIFLIFAAEAFNTALEHLTDLVSPEYHVLAGKTKDAAAAGVLLIAMGVFLVGLLIFVPKLWLRLSFFF